MIVYSASSFIGIVSLLVAAPFVLAWALTAFLGRSRGIFWIGSCVAMSLPFVLAITDPDGSCDDTAWCLFDITPGEWFVIGVGVAVPPWIGWALGVAVGRLVHRDRRTGETIGA